MPNVKRVNAQDASPKQLLISWANGQDAWIRAMVAEVILSQNPLPESGIKRIFDMFLAEKGFTDSDQPDVPLLEVDESEDSEDETFEIVSLDKIQGVNALSEGNSIEFDSGLTVLFGQNGSGKTGYSRILKRAAAVRTAERILPNAHAVGPQPDPSARITYRVNGEEHEVVWKNEAGLAPFTRISVFDSPAVTMHVDTELGYVYTPAELALFSLVSQGIKAVQQHIISMASGLRPGANPFLAQFSNGTSIYPVIETLGATTDASDLDRLVAELPEDAHKQLAELQDEVNALRGGSFDALIETTKQRIADLQRLRRLVTMAAGFDDAAYKDARDVLLRAEAERRRAREELFRPEELPGPPGDEWQQFVSAGEAYRTHLGLHDYPGEGDRCLYCRQELSPVALELIQRYRTFLDENLVRRVTDAQRDVDQRALRLTGIETGTIGEYLTSLLATKRRPDWAETANALVQDALKVAAATGNRGACEVNDLGSRANVLLTTLGAEIKREEEAVGDLKTQKNNREESLTGKQKELDEWAARVTLRRNLTATKSYVANAKQAVRLDELTKHISNHELKQLTEQSKLASEDLVNKSFEQLFAEESAALSAPMVALEFQGRSGKAERKKVVAHHKPSEILSEGEQKVLALADFLAEGRMRGAKAPIVFDDPVTSLDYRRMEEVCKRINKLTESHQVIVFTHNIMFASSLIGLRQKKKLRAKFYEVRDRGGEKGIIAADVEPRFDTPAEIGKKINVTIERAKGAEATLQDALVERGYDLLRSWCEAFVEQELLGNVSQRYRANIMMGKLGEIRPDRFDETASAVNEMFEKACRCMTGHSQPQEQLNIHATLADLERDWEKAQKIRAAYMAKN
jgi:hypothetical protein